MPAEAVTLMAATAALLWGGLAVAIVHLARHPGEDHMPDGGEDGGEA